MPNFHWETQQLAISRQYH